MDYNVSNEDNLLKIVTCSDDNTVIYWNLKLDVFILNPISNKKSQNIYYSKSIKHIFYYCKNVKEFHISEFKEIKFKINQLEKYFVFNYKDLFYYKDDLIYFLILFQEININSFKIGHIFLKKYNLVFNSCLPKNM